MEGAPQGGGDGGHDSHSSESCAPSDVSLLLCHPSNVSLALC
jgi:hypothetical protein